MPCLAGLAVNPQMGSSSKRLRRIYVDAVLRNRGHVTNLTRCPCSGREDKSAARHLLPLMTELEPALYLCKHQSWRSPMNCNNYSSCGLLVINHLGCGNPKQFHATSHHPGGTRWLLGVDNLSGQVRQPLLNDAIASGNVARVR